MPFINEQNEGRVPEWTNGLACPPRPTFSGARRGLAPLKAGRTKSRPAFSGAERASVPERVPRVRIPALPPVRIF